MSTTHMNEESGTRRLLARTTGVSRIAGDRLTLAVQRNGRLTEHSLALIRDAGLRFEHHGERLLSHCQNFPLTLLFSRDDDIPQYVAGGTVDLGIVGRNLLYEEAVEARVTEVLPLGFGHCSLVVAVPVESAVTRVEELAGAIVASAYPQSARRFFTEQGLAVETVTLRGSVEVAPTLGLAAAIVELTVSGTSLLLHDLRTLHTILTSEAVLVAHPASLADPAKRRVLNRLLLRLKAVQDARRYKYVMMNAPKSALPAIQQVTPGLKSPTVLPLADPEWIAVHAAVPEDAFWDAVERLREAGSSEVLVAPLEKLLL